PTRTDVLNKNTVYEYDYDLIEGTVDEIRQYVYQTFYTLTRPRQNPSAASRNQKAIRKDVR
ncbi:MAG: hypothetical protein ACYC6C_11210, partial [Coriobacteriia bacterium]